jgi:hypothetical protein
LKTKVKAQFNRTVTERSKPFFYRFCQSNRCHFAGHFTLVTLGRRIDRQWVASKLPSILPKAGGQSPERSQRGAAQPRVERSKSAKPTLRPSAYIFQPATPPGSFPFLLQRKHFLNSTLGWPLGDPCVTLGWRLGDPCVTQSQSQSQVSAEGCSSSFGQMQLPTAICFIFKDLCPSRPEALANSRRFLRANQVRKRTMALRVTIAK